MEYGKCAIAQNLTGGVGFGSTEFHVLRAGEVIVPEWIYYFLRQESTRKQAERTMTGSAGQKRVPTRFLEDVPIPLPPLPEQQRIAAILARADRLRRLRRYALALSEGYLQAVFVEMFGDPMRNPMGWKWATVQDVSVKVTDGEHVTPQRTQTGIKLLSARNIQNGFIDFTTGLDYIPEYEYERIKRRCNPERGDILMSCSGTVGRVTTVDIDETFSMVRSVALIKPDPTKVKAKYLEHFLRSEYGQRQIEQSAKASSQANIFNEPIRKLPVIVPPLSDQGMFAGVVRQYECLRAQQREAARQAEQLFDALLDRAFRGEL
jgi:type I restriction enzyme S subunit